MKESIDMNDAPPLELNNCLYNCSKCSSNIEILSLDENKIKFICNNKHNIDIEIKEYLKKMKKYLDMNNAPPLELKNCLCNCSECSSNVEMLSLDENK